MSLMDFFPGEPRGDQEKVINQIENAFKYNKYIICRAPTGSGKAQPLYCKIKTPYGWTTMRNIDIGDIISTPDGKFAEITHIHPQGMKEIWKVVFKDGRISLCCEDHLWKIHSNNFSKKWKVVDTKELKRQTELKTSKPHIPLLYPNMDEEDKELPLDPYLLGCLLGDGFLSKNYIGFSSSDNFIINQFVNLLPEKYLIKKTNNRKYDYRIIQKKAGSHKYPFRLIIEEIGVINLHSYNKFIPTSYKNISYNQKLSLLQGILDTDGYICKNGSIVLCQTSKQLALDVIEIINSIGGIGRIRREHYPKCYKKDEIVIGKKAYTVSIRFPNPEKLFRLPRKLNRVPKNYQYKDLKLGVEKVIKTGIFEECKCITINSKDNLYITDEYVVTHNSHVGATLALSTEYPSEKVMRDKITPKSHFGENSDKYDKYGAFILTTSKQLQDQYKSLFQDCRLLKGKQNYSCGLDPICNAGCAKCIYMPYIMGDCAKNGICEYINSYSDAMKSNFSVLNYSMFFTLPECFKKKNILICDEASEMEDTVVSHFSININYNYLDYFDIPYSQLKKDDSESGYLWIGELLDNLIMSMPSNRMLNRKNVSKYITDKAKTIKDMIEKLRLLHNYWNDSEFIVELTKDGVLISPLKINKLVQKMFSNVDKVVFLSATIINHVKMAETFGIGIDEYTFIDVKSHFNPKKSPIYISPAKFDMTYNKIDSSLNKMIKSVLKLTEDHKNEKGIIHTHNFKITKALQNNVENDSRFLFRDKFSSNEDILYEHFNNSEPTILVSPSLVFGTSLDNEFGRFQIITKLPYLPMDNKRVKILSERDFDWYQMKMWIKLIQMCGRCTRSENDYSATYIFDKSFLSAIKRYQNKLPKWFKDRLI